MSSPTHSNISQNDAECSKSSTIRCNDGMRSSSSPSFDYKRQQKPVVQSMWPRKPEEKWRPKPRKRVAEEEEKKKRTMEYLQQLQDEVLEEEAALLEGAEGSQVAGSKCKGVAAGDEEGQQPSKKARDKYRRDATVKMRGSNLCKRCVCAGQDCLVHPLLWNALDLTFYFIYFSFDFIFFFLFFFF